MTKAVGIEIIGFGGCSSLGYTLPATLAAMGAGLSNFSDTGLKSAYGTAVSAGALLHKHLPRGERLAQLANFGILDLQTLLKGLRLSRVPVMLGLPSDITLKERNQIQQALERFPELHPKAADYPYGRASTFVAIADAMRLIERGVHRHIVVGGIDSLCAANTIQGLIAAERILGPHSEGTIPGEASAFALLAQFDEPSSNPSTSLTIEAVFRHQSQPFDQTQKVSGDGLAAIFRSFREWGSTKVDRVIAAHSGEGYFGRSFAHAYLRETEIMPEPLTVDLTADCVGDTGAAAGVLGLSFARYLLATTKPGIPGRALIYSESDNGVQGAAIVAGSPSAWMDDSIANSLAN
ncbi:hypothetical protein [Ideonella sp. A 288]|uniref:hypothetical protein n=1 Tax=Ideonella sp. A 288 TaxID=1962181 RepID=UPI001184AA0F|nr:hypothetical protein [Ideonella sp. A 288]